MLRTNIREKKTLRLKDLPLGALVKDLQTMYYGDTIVWRIADQNHDSYPQNSVTLASDRILTIKAFDACEPLNPTTYCATRGNSRYLCSNIRSWANSAANAGEWYAPLHDYDAPPAPGNIQSQRNAYDHESGFLNGFSPEFRASLMPTALTALVSDTYGGGEDAFEDKIFLPSLAELGLQNLKKIDEGSCMALFADKENLPAKPTQACAENSGPPYLNFTADETYSWWTRSAYTRDAYTCTYINPSGANTSLMAYYTTIGFRPFCNLPEQTRVSLYPDIDGVYIMFA